MASRADATGRMTIVGDRQLPIDRRVPLIREAQQERRHRRPARSASVVNVSSLDGTAQPQPRATRPRPGENASTAGSRPNASASGGGEKTPFSRPGSASPTTPSDAARPDRPHERDRLGGARDIHALCVESGAERAGGARGQHAVAAQDRHIGERPAALRLECELDGVSGAAHHERAASPGGWTRSAPSR